MYIPNRPKVVLVRSYQRFRFGRWESVVRHFRSMPNA